MPFQFSDTTTTPQLIHFINNWGRQWGNAGTGYLPYKYFKEYCNDAWAIELQPQLLLNRKEYINHQFVIQPGALYNRLGNLSVVINLWHPPSHTRVGWSLATVRDEWFEIEDFFIRPDYQGDKRHLLSLAAETFRFPIYQELPVRFWIPDADTHAKGANFAVVNDFVRLFGLRVRPSGVKWAPYRAEMPEPPQRLPQGVSSGWPNELTLRHQRGPLSRLGGSHVAQASRDEPLRYAKLA